MQYLVVLDRIYLTKLFILHAQTITELSKISVDEKIYWYLIIPVYNRGKHLVR